MVSRFLAAIALLALPSLNAIGVMADGSCVPECISASQDKFGDFGCTARDEVGCLCLNANFVNSISGCSVGKCGGASPDEIRGNLLAPGAFSCQNFAANLPAAPQLPSSSKPPAPSSTESPPPTSSTSSTTSSTTSSPTSTSTTTSPALTTTPVATKNSTSTGTSSSTRTSAVATGTSSATSSPDSASSGSVSPGAAAGIGIGMAAIVALAAGIAFYLYRKKQNRSVPRYSMQISKPLPGSGRTFPNRDPDHNDAYDKFNDIEMTTNRYEDMVPSQQPRTMV